uniref:Uncharacterized protein n=1 Tax=Globodera rostochiensis TaxID=31243 RepID=A0A914IEV3_GLORO
MMSFLFILILVCLIEIISDANGQTPAERQNIIESSKNEAKAVIAYGNALEFLKIFFEVDQELNLDSSKFNRMSNDQQISFIFTYINIKLEENEREIGESLQQITNNLLNYCQHFGSTKYGSDKKTINHFLLVARRTCFIGMFVSLAEFINKKMSEIIEHAQIMSVRVRRVSAVPTQFLQRQNDSQIQEMNTNISDYAICVEHMFIFWTRMKSEFIAAEQPPHIGDNGNANDVENGSWHKIKQQLNELTRKSLHGFDKN